MKQKILGIVLALMLLCSTAQAAEMTLTVSAPDVLPTAGEDFTVEIRLTNNPGLSVAQFTLAYDPDVICCERAETGAILSGALSAANPNASGGAIIAAASADPIEGDGTIGVFTFQVLKSGTPNLALKDCVFRNAAGDPISPRMTEASTSTPRPSAPKPTETKEESKLPNRSDDPIPSGTQAESGMLPETPCFSDVPADYWGYEPIWRAAELGLINGYTDGTFRPDVNVTRAQFVAMLWRMAGKPEAAGEASFTDTVGLSADFRFAIDWAAERGIVNGVSAAAFCPDIPISRQQVMAILFRYHGGISGMELILTAVYDAQFADSASISPELKSGVYWAVYHGIVSGVTSTSLAPQGTATRAQAAAILIRYIDRNM